MKYLIKKVTGFYDNNNNLINDNISIFEKINKYGFMLSELKNNELLINNRLVSNADTNTVIKFNNQSAYILINFDFYKYDNLIFNDDFYMAISNDGITWRSMITEEDYFNERKFNIDLNTINMTDESDIEFKNFVKFLDETPRKVSSIKNNKYIKYIFIKLDNTLSSIVSNINPTGYTLEKDKEIQVNYTNFKITITNNKKNDVKTLNVNIIKNDYVKNTLSEF